jgi:glucose/arabinose dehydrogenase
MTRKKVQTVALLVVLVTVSMSACGGDDDGGSAAEGASFRKLVALEFPTAMAQLAGTDEFFVTERNGLVRRVRIDGDQATVDDAPAIDLVDKVGEGDAPVGETGLVGLTFSPDGSKLYLSMTENDPAGDHLRTIYEYTMNGDQIDAASARLLVSVPVDAWHLGGGLVFGPDGYLYISLGDGAGMLDRGNTGQNPNDLLASILRIDPSQPAGDKPYSIPADNPFVNGGGAPEVWLYGTRNPWRFSFDENGDLWIGDVGDSKREEIDYLPAENGKDAGKGANLVWSLFEGTLRPNFRKNIPAPDDVVMPIYEWPHEDGGGCAVIAGFVYRGDVFTDLDGQFLFGDICTAKLSALQRNGDGDPTVTEIAEVPGALNSFGTDDAGRVYALTQDAVLELVAEGGGGGG